MCVCVYAFVMTSLGVRAEADDTSASHTFSRATSRCLHGPQPVKSEWLKYQRKSVQSMKYNRNHGQIHKAPFTISIEVQLSLVKLGSFTGYSHLHNYWMEFHETIKWSPEDESSPLSLMTFPSAPPWGFLLNVSTTMDVMKCVNSHIHGNGNTFADIWTLLGHWEHFHKSQKVSSKPLWLNRRPSQCVKKSPDKLIQQGPWKHIIIFCCW